MSGAGPVVGCVLVAAGSGTRLGLGIPKALASAGGATLLELAVAAAAGSDPETGAPVVDHLVVVVPAAERTACTALVERAWSAAHRTDRVVVVPGGADRQASVAAGVDATGRDVEVVLVHDAARALTPSSVFAAVAGAVRGDVVAVVPGLTPADTVKRLRPAAEDRSAVDGTRTVAETLDRSSLVAVQTPQGFRADVLRRLHRSAARPAVGEPSVGEPSVGEPSVGEPSVGEPSVGDPSVDVPTDDAGMAEAAGYAVVVLPGHPEAFKVTTALDLVLARALLQERPPGQDGSRDS